MNWPRVAELPYRADSLPWVAPWAQQPWSMWLTSGPPGARQGRYELFAAEPWITLQTWGTQSEIVTPEGLRTSGADPLDLLRDLLQPQVVSCGDLPFCGGALGYFGYELVQRWQPWLNFRPSCDGWPDLAVGIYDWAVIIDHLACRTWLVGQGRAHATRLRWRELCARFSAVPAVAASTPPEACVVRRPEARWDFPGYAAAFQSVQAYLQAGDCYQINLALRFTAQLQGTAWPLFGHLCRLSPAPFAAYLNLPAGEILSASPERFLAVKGAQVWTEPIKGTRPRGADATEDARLAAALQRSAKDRAENVMIVDLLRNDLGRVCIPGSIQVEALCELRQFAQVQHLVSRIRGRLAMGRDALDLLRATLPGGSVTGVPKRRALEIIDALEPARRGVYCGSIGYLGFDGRMDSNLAIRTLSCHRGLLTFWAGGGIVADSALEAEYHECYAKARALLELLSLHP